MHRRSGAPLVALLLALAIIPGRLEAQVPATGLRFAVSFDRDTHPGPIRGRVFVIVSNREPDTEPRFTTGGGTSGTPLFGIDVFDWVPGVPVIVDADVFGFPYASLADLPPGDYRVQVLVNIYSEFRRSDGNVLWMHDDQWEGQQPFRSPGNLYSDVLELHLHPGEERTVLVTADHVIPPIEIPPDTPHVKRIRFRSPMLSAFWGRDIYIGATVLLPEGYDEHPAATYPVIYQQGHFSLRPPLGFREPDGGEPTEFYTYWTGGDAPRVIGVTFQHPTPYYDDSYAVNSPNVGPYGDAIMQELIPYLEEHFRMKREPWARVLTGGSTGGWEALALQVFHPDDFGGTWALCPDPVDFRYYKLIDIYADENAYWREYNGLRTELPEARDTDGRPRYTNRDMKYYERVLGPNLRSGGQWAIWEAVFGPIGPDGFAAPLWDWYTGEIDHEVATEWRRYDLRHVLETNWAGLGPKLVGKIHVYTGDMDTYFLESAVMLLEEFLESTTDPYFAGSVSYGDRQPHCWGPRGSELVELIERHLLDAAPTDADVSTWRY